MITLSYKPNVDVVDQDTCQIVKRDAIDILINGRYFRSFGLDIEDDNLGILIKRAIKIDIEEELM